MSALYALAAPVGRLLLSSIFIMSGVNKIAGYEGTQAYMESMGVPGGLLPLVIIVEVLAGLAVLIGFKARIAALLLAGFCVLSAALFHANFSDQMQMIMFMKNMALAGAFLLIFANGSGAYALDNKNG